MKTIWLMRHAKSDWSHAGQLDHERTLAPRGRLAAPRMGQLISQSDHPPTHALCSTATRTRETLDHVLTSLAPSVVVAYLEQLYHCPALTIPLQLATLPADATSVLVVGHNPGMQELVRAWSGKPHDVPTATVAQFQIDVSDWADFQAATLTRPLPRLVAIARPDDFGLGGGD